MCYNLQKSSESAAGKLEILPISIIDPTTIVKMRFK